MKILKEKHLSIRLQQVADFVENPSVVADIGSDHGYLPVYLVEKDISQKAICGEVVKGPYQATIDEVKKNHLENKIEVRLGDGLEILQPTDDISVVSICGMGGKLIVDILNRGFDKLTDKMDLLLEPNINEPLVRQWLVDHHYDITKEAIVRENKKTYEIIYAKKRKEKVSLEPHEIFFGPKLLEEKNETFQNKWAHVLKTRQKILQQLEAAERKENDKIEAFKQEIAWIKEWI